jgi:hypothetical protein
LSCKQSDFKFYLKLEGEILKLSVGLIEHRAMKTYVGVQVYLHNS